jgi:hypothetical protein
MRIVPEEDDAVFGDGQVDLDGVRATLVEGRPEKRKESRVVDTSVFCMLFCFLSKHSSADL